MVPVPVPITICHTSARCPLSWTSKNLQSLLGVPWHYLSHSTLPFNSHCPQTPAASSLADYNSLLTNRLLVSPPPIHCCHSNLPKTPFNHAKPLIKNLHYLFITTRIKSKRLSFLLLSGLNPHFQFIAYFFHPSLSTLLMLWSAVTTKSCSDRLLVQPEESAPQAASCVSVPTDVLWSCMTLQACVPHLTSSSWVSRLVHRTSVVFGGTGSLCFCHGLIWMVLHSVGSKNKSVIANRVLDHRLGNRVLCH